MSIRLTIHRQLPEEGELVDTPIEIEASRDGYGELVIEPDMKLTPEEQIDVALMLAQDERDDWDENGWQARREM
jgi:hypothetical protein